MIKKTYLFLFILLGILFSSCVTTQKLPAEYSEQYFTIVDKNWTDIAPYIQMYDYKNKYIEYHIAKINLNASIEINSYPLKSGWIKPKSVQSFAKRNNAIVAVNTTPFLSKAKYIPWAQVKPVGINKANYIEYSPASNKYSCLAFFYNENEGFTAKIFEKQDTEELKNASYAFGGFFTIYNNNQIYDFIDIKDTRTAVAHSDNGKTLYLLTGKGLSYKDCAIIFKNLNVDCAMEFDGGGSSQMTVKNKNTIKQPVKRNISSILGLSIQ